MIFERSTDVVRATKPVYGFNDVREIFRNGVIEHVPLHVAVFVDNDVAQAPQFLPWNVTERCQCLVGEFLRAFCACSISLAAEFLSRRDRASSSALLNYATSS